jgi:hypothetical protein
MLGNSDRYVIQSLPGLTRPSVAARRYDRSVAGRDEWVTIIERWYKPIITSGFYVR